MTRRDEIHARFQGTIRQVMIDHADDIAAALVDAIQEVVTEAFEAGRAVERAQREDGS